MDIPYWEFRYIYGDEEFPNSQVKNFYKFFKKEFLNGKPIDVGEQSNYYFFLMFDLIKSKTKNLETHLKRLMNSYPKTIPYCEHEMSKLGISCRYFDGENYINIDKAGFCHDIFIVKEDFENKELIDKTIGYFPLLGQSDVLKYSFFVDSKRELHLWINLSLSMLELEDIAGSDCYLEFKESLANLQELLTRGVVLNNHGTILKYIKDIYELSERYTKEALYGFLK